MQRCHNGIQIFETVPAFLCVCVIIFVSPDSECTATVHYIHGNDFPLVLLYQAIYSCVQKLRNAQNNFDGEDTFVVK